MVSSGLYRGKREKKDWGRGLMTPEVNFQGIGQVATKLIFFVILVMAASKESTHL